ncbi:MAG: type II toxin-antitoxin system VapC family toxin [Chloroflexota bacterium]
MSLYVDTSGLVKTVIKEVGSEEAITEIAHHSRHYTCRVTYAEVHAALGLAHRLQRLTSSQLAAGQATFDEAWESFLRVDVSEPVVREAGRLAVEMRLRGYDAVQLAGALAASRIEPIVLMAWDVQLRDAARACRLEVFPEGN